MFVIRKFPGDSGRTGQDPAPGNPYRKFPGKPVSRYSIVFTFHWPKDIGRTIEGFYPIISIGVLGFSIIIPYKTV